LNIDRRQLFVAGIASAAVGELTSAAPLSLVRNTRGRISYIGEDGKERGREWFGVSRREDGQVTLRAYCEIDDARVERDVVQSMTAKFEPLDCFVRLHVGGKFSGTGWIRCSDTEAECEVYSVVLGRVQQRMPLVMPATTLVSHPISTDALLLSRFDHSKPDRVQTWRGGLATSTQLDGGSGPFLSVDGERSLEYVGPESVTTAAGRFDTHHYRLMMSAPRSYDLWCTHPDYLIVRGEVRGYLKNKTGYGRYDLIEYSGHREGP
jgi:hypothetical protein